eukprot:c8357_g1_i1.p1 GENE.c8357_g1_i1~~c8357_g1_i1.p1  ORF type:complete len:348 (-),score=62.61 c8357_g1_i1:57-1100(-)
MISGSFSLVSQAIALGHVPRMKIYHTSPTIYGQGSFALCLLFFLDILLIEKFAVYLPIVNWLLMILCVVLIVAFKHSTDLASMYGLAVASNMVGTSVVLLLVMHYVWRWKLWKILLYCCTLFVLDLLLWTAVMEKMASFAWVSLLFGGFFAVIMHAWTSCRAELNARSPSTLKLEEFAQTLENEDMHQVMSIDSVGVFLDSSAAEHVPVVLLQLMNQMALLPKTILILHVNFESVPFVGCDDQLEYTKISSRIHRVVLNVGFADPKPNILEVYHRVIAAEWYEGSTLSSNLLFFIGNREVLINKRASYASICKWKLYLLLESNQTPAYKFFFLPNHLTLRLGQMIEL